VTRITIVDRTSTIPLSYIATKLALELYEVFTVFLAVTHAWNAGGTNQV
jgi:hypothetical protein